MRDAGAALHVTERGPIHGPSHDLPILLVHGTMDRAASFRRLMAALPEAHIISYDRRGYAGSAGRGPSTGFADQVDDLLEVVDGRPVVAFGHSFGGDVVLAAAAAHPELIRSAVVWEPPMPWVDWWPSQSAGSVALAGAADPEEAAEAFMVQMIGLRIWERLPAETRRRRRAEGPTLIAEMGALRARAPWDPAEVSVPVLVARGGECSPHQKEGTAELARRLPSASLRVVDDARHGAHLSHPRHIAALIREAAAAAPPESSLTARSSRVGPAAAVPMARKEGSR